MNISLAAAMDAPRQSPEGPARPSIHRELAAADMKGEALNKFAVFALGWFGNKSPEEAVICLQRYQRMLAEGKSA